MQEKDHRRDCDEPICNSHVICNSVEFLFLFFSNIQRKKTETKCKKTNTKKQHSEILTGTPIKQKLDEARKKKIKKENEKNLKNPMKKCLETPVESKIDLKGRKGDNFQSHLNHPLKPR